MDEAVLPPQKGDVDESSRDEVSLEKGSGLQTHTKEIDMV